VVRPVSGQPPRGLTYGRDEGGQALIEFALVLPLLVVFLVGVIEVSQAWRSSQAVTHAAREGARLSVVPTSTSATVTTRVQETLRSGSLDPARAEIVLRRRTGTGTLDTVTVRYPYRFLFLAPAVRLAAGGSGELAEGTVWLSSTFVMRNE